MNEQEARRLYGPPPEGDEDPHASQAVPDPGATSGPPRLTAGQLSGNHLGQRVRVTDSSLNTSMAGMLTKVTHESSIILGAGIISPDSPMTIGRRYVQLQFGLHTGGRFSADATVELLD